MLCAGVPDGGEKREASGLFESGVPKKRYRIDLACRVLTRAIVKVVPTYALNQGPLVF
jgi:hypothetical protein